MVFRELLRPEASTLKPSLVEWKLRAVGRNVHSDLHLETFLSGMETKEKYLYLLFLI